MYKVYRTVNKQPRTLIDEFSDKEQAKAYAKSMRKHLTQGERKYYKLSYVVR